MGYVFSFEKLDVWQKSRLLVIKVYAHLKVFPQEERYGLISQLQRAVVSVTANLAEGTSRSSYKEKLRFTEITYGSLMETYCLLTISKDLGYLKVEHFEELTQIVNEIARMLNALRTTQQKHRDTTL